MGEQLQREAWAEARGHRHAENSFLADTLHDGGQLVVIWYLVWCALDVLAHLVPNYFFVFLIIKLVVEFRAHISKGDVLGQLAPVVVEQS